VAWVYLLLAGLMEVAWPLGLKYSDGLTRFWPVFGGIAAMAASLGFFALAARSVPLGAGYAVWTGLGAAGTALIGMALFGEPATFLRIACLGAIVGGAVGLKLLSP
jgi:quaternary ammonium compound-resistance protein SugE